MFGIRTDAVSPPKVVVLETTKGGVIVLNLISSKLVFLTKFQAYLMSLKPILV